MTIVASIHQPRKEIFMMFDQMLLLSLGRTIYCGKTEVLLICPS
jgi:ABC-type multidrug transport system ATPase subunit